MSRASAVDLTEQHLSFALPRHLGELLHRGDQQGGQLPVNLVVHYHDRDAFARRLGTAKQALAQRIAAILNRPTSAAAERLHENVFAWTDRFAAPRTVFELGRGTAA